VSEENKAIVRRLVEDVWNKGHLSVADQLIFANYSHQDNATPDFGSGAESEKKRATLYRTAFPDLQFSIEDIIAEGGTAICRWTSRGTHRGPFSGIAPTGKILTISGTTINRLVGGKIVEGWVNWDALGLLQQIDVIPVLFKTKGATN
jgi:steroid delta-isomerase-like uncharacterized protein